MTGLERFIEWAMSNQKITLDHGSILYLSEALDKARSVAEEEKAKEQGLIKELSCYINTLTMPTEIEGWEITKEELREILAKYKEAENGK